MNGPTDALATHAMAECKCQPWQEVNYFSPLCYGAQDLYVITGSVTIASVARPSDVAGAVGGSITTQSYNGAM